MNYARFVLLYVCVIAIQTIKYSELSKLEKIAEGGFGVVYRAKHPRWQTVAYKELKTTIIPERLKFVH